MKPGSRFAASLGVVQAILDAGLARRRPGRLLSDSNPVLIEAFVPVLVLSADPVFSVLPSMEPFTRSFLVSRIHGSWPDQPRQFSGAS